MRPLQAALTLLLLSTTACGAAMFPNVDSAADPDNPLGQSLVSVSAPAVAPGDDSVFRGAATVTRAVELPSFFGAATTHTSEGPTLVAAAAPTHSTGPTMFIPAFGGPPRLGIPVGGSMMLPVFGGPPVPGIPAH